MCVVFFFSSRRRHTICALVTGVQTCALPIYAVGAITRMRDMKVEPFLLASTLRAVIAQRLVRRLCPACRQPVQAPQALAARLGFEIGTIVYQPVGCALCNGPCFTGRTGVFEIIRVARPEGRRVGKAGVTKRRTRWSLGY